MQPACASELAGHTACNRRPTSTHRAAAQAAQQRAGRAGAGASTGAGARGARAAAAEAARGSKALHAPRGLQADKQGGEVDACRRRPLRCGAANRRRFRPAAGLGRRVAAHLGAANQGHLGPAVCRGVPAVVAPALRRWADEAEEGLASGGKSARPDPAGRQVQRLAASLAHPHLLSAPPACTVRTSSSEPLPHPASSSFEAVGRLGETRDGGAAALAVDCRAAAPPSFIPPRPVLREPLSLEPPEDISSEQSWRERRRTTLLSTASEFAAVPGSNETGGRLPKPGWRRGL